MGIIHEVGAAYSTYLTVQRFFMSQNLQSTYASNQRILQTLLLEMPAVTGRSQLPRFSDQLISMVLGQAMTTYHDNSSVSRTEEGVIQH